MYEIFDSKDFPLRFTTIFTFSICILTTIKQLEYRCLYHARICRTVPNHPPPPTFPPSERPPHLGYPRPPLCQQRKARSVPRLLMLMYMMWSYGRESMLDLQRVMLCRVTDVILSLRNITSSGSLGFPVNRIMRLLVWFGGRGLNPRRMLDDVSWEGFPCSVSAFLSPNIWIG